MTQIKLSAAIATFNEEENIGDCLESIKDIVDEIIIVDGGSKDKTVQIAESFNAKVYKTTNPPIFHINKQKSFDACRGEWILYLDADERVTKKLGEEILKVIRMSDSEVSEYQKTIKNINLFRRHQKLLDHRDGKIGEDDSEFVAFFIPRLNYFLGKFLRYGGVYPDGVIRLFKNKKAYLPAKDVHEQMVVKGRVGWLQNDLIHYDSRTFSRYLKRNSRYIDLIVSDLKKNHQKPRFFDYVFFKPIYWFLMTSLRNKGVLDGFQGLTFSFFSALRFPRAYWRFYHK